MRKVSFVVTALLAVVMFPVIQLSAQQIDNVVVELDASGVTIPASATSVTVVLFLQGNSADPFGPTPPNGDLVFIGGNTIGIPGPTQGLLASFGCGVPTLTAPADIGFPAANYLIAVEAGASTLSNHGDTMTVDVGTGLACITGDPDGDPTTDDREHADNAFAQTFDISGEGDLTVGNVLVGVENAVEGNNPLGVDTDGDGLGDAPPVLDGLIPVTLHFFWTTPQGSITFNGMGPDQTADAVVDSNIDVGGGMDCPFIPGDINEDGMVTLLDVAGFVTAVQTQDASICQADINGDGMVSLLDVGPFVDLF